MKGIRRQRKWLQFALGLFIWHVSQPATAWDAGSSSRKHDEGTGGENPITILDTRPYWAESRTLTNSGRVADCPDGYTNTGLTCYRGPDTYTKGCTTIFKKYECKPGYTDNGCFCGRGADSLGMSSMVCQPGEVRLELSGGTIPRCYTAPVCSEGYEYWGFRCYIGAPGVVRTAVSTVKMDVRQSGNTHLWIVNRALDLLAKSDDPGVVAFVTKMRDSAIRNTWENGLWDGDGPDYVDFPEHMGTHFYNTAAKDWNGNPTNTLTYDIVEGSIIPIVGGIAGGATAGVAGAAIGAGGSAAAGRLIFKNTSSCSNARECAKAALATLGGTINATNAYSLGLALHYMTDMTQPMHASGYDGFKIPNNLHPQWEYYVPYVQGKFPADSITWDKRWNAMDPDGVFDQSALKSNGFASRLSQALHLAGDAGIVTIQSFNGIGPYTGYNFYHDAVVDALTGEILRDAYQSTASYLYAIYATSKRNSPAAPTNLNVVVK